MRWPRPIHWATRQAGAVGLTDPRCLRRLEHRRWAMTPAPSGQGTSPFLASDHCLEGLRQKATHPAKLELARPGQRCAISSEPDFRYGTFLKPARPATTRPRATPTREAAQA